MLKIEQVAEHLGLTINEQTSLEDFSTGFANRFLIRETAHTDPVVKANLSGAVTGSLSAFLKAQMKASGFDVDMNFIKDKETGKNKKIEDIITDSVSMFNAKIAELDKPNDLSADEKVKEVTGKLNKVQKAFDDLKTLHDQTVTDFESFKTNTTTENKNRTKNTEIEKVHSGIKWKTGITEFEKEGFFAVTSKKYKLDHDDTEGLFVTDLAGSRINSTKVAGKFKTYGEILEEEAKAGKLLAESDITKKSNEQRQKNANFIAGGNQEQNNHQLDRSGNPRQTARRG